MGEEKKKFYSMETKETRLRWVHIYRTVGLTSATAISVGTPLVYISAVTFSLKVHSGCENTIDIYTNSGSIQF